MTFTRTSYISTVTLPIWRLSRPHSADSSQTPPSHAPCCRLTWSVVDRTGGVRRWHLRRRQHAGAQRRRAPPTALHRLLTGEQRQYQGHAVACEPPPCWPSVTQYTFALPSTLASWPLCLCGASCQGCTHWTHWALVIEQALAEMGLAGPSP